MKILVINTAFLGDVIFSAPLIDSLLTAGHRVTLLTRPRYGALLARPGLALLEFDKRGAERGTAATIRLGRRLRAARFDVVLGAHPSARSGALAWLSRAPRRVGWGAIGYHTRVPRGPRFVEDQLALAAAIGVPPTIRRPQIAVPVTRDATRIGLVPGSRWGTKRWPPARWAALATRLASAGLTPVWCGGPDEAHLAEGPGERCFPGPLDAVARALARCAVVVGGDSGLGHLARAVGTPVVMLFGPTDAARHPPDPGRLDLTVAGLACRPCSPHGPATCPRRYHRCMEDLTLAAVNRGIYSLLGP